MTSRFIPQLWSARLLFNLQAKTVYANIVNRDYEGEIKNQGDTVKINSISNVTIGKYVKGQDIGKAESLTGQTTELKIDQANFFNITVDDIDAVQANVKLMDAGMVKAGVQLADAFDKAIAESYVDAGLTLGTDEAPVVITKENVFDAIMDAGLKLDEANVQTDGRFMVVPHFVASMLARSPQFLSANNEVAKNGYVGTAGGFQIYASSNVPNTAGEKYKVLAGTRQAISVAEQISSIKTYEPEGTFATNVKGLHVFGVAVVQPDALLTMTVNRG